MHTQRLNHFVIRFCFNWKEMSSTVWYAYTTAYVFLWVTLEIVKRNGNTGIHAYIFHESNAEHWLRDVTAFWLIVKSSTKISTSKKTNLRNHSMVPWHNHRHRLYSKEHSAQCSIVRALAHKHHIGVHLVYMDNWCVWCDTMKRWTAHDSWSWPLICRCMCSALFCMYNSYSHSHSHIIEKGKMNGERVKC